LATGQITQLTDAKAEWSPPTGLPRWKPGMALYGMGKYAFHVWNTAPCEAADGTIVFTSNRWGVMHPKAPRPSFQLARMDADGRNAAKIGFLNLAEAVDPSIGPDGRVYFTSAEVQGIRRGPNYCIWSINPDGTDWRPEHSITGFEDTLGGEIPLPWHL